MRSVRDRIRQQKAIISLKTVTKCQIPLLSQDSLIESLTNQLEERLNDFQSDVNSGLFIV